MQGKAALDAERCDVADLLTLQTLLIGGETPCRGDACVTMREEIEGSRASHSQAPGICCQQRRIERRLLGGISIESLPTRPLYGGAGRTWLYSQTTLSWDEMR